MEFDLVYIIIIVACTLNILVSLFIFRRDDLEPFQKGAQIFIVWLLPFISAIGLWLFHRSNDSDTPNRGSFGGGARDSIGSSGGAD